MTITHGSATFPTGRVLARGAVAVWAINPSCYHVHRKKIWTRSGSFPGGFRLDVSAKFLAHRREHLLRKSVFLTRTKTHKQRGGEYVDGHCFVNSRLNRPAAFAGI